MCGYIIFHSDQTVKECFPLKGPLSRDDITLHQNHRITFQLSWYQHQHRHHCHHTYMYIQAPEYLIRYSQCMRFQTSLKPTENYLNEHFTLPSLPLVTLLPLRPTTKKNVLILNFLQDLSRKFISERFLLFSVPKNIKQDDLRNTPKNFNCQNKKIIAKHFFCRFQAAKFFNP